MPRNTSSSLLIALSLLAGLAPLVACGTSQEGTTSSSPSNGTSASSPATNATSIKISGPTSIHLGAAQTYSASVTNSNSALQWQVDGITGGSPAVGVISNGGVFTPPASIPSTNTITISAVSGAATDSVLVSLMQPVPNIASASLVSSDGGKTATLTVKGTNLNSNATLLVSGNPISTKSANGVLTGLVTSIPAGTTQLQAAIQNAGPGATTSAVMGVVLQLQVLPTLTVSGPTSIRLGATQTFTSTIANGSGQPQWLVNGIVGGSSTFGTITNKGIYTPPQVVPTENSITVSAMLGSVVGNVNSTLLQAVPTVLTATLVSSDGGNTAELTVNAANLTGNSVVLLAGAPISTGVSGSILTANLSGASIGKTPPQFTVQNSGPGAATSAPFSVPLSVEATSARAAGRLLAQSTFGATMSLLQQVQSQGLAAYVDQQLNAQPSQFDAIITGQALPAYCNGNGNYCVWYSWWQHAFEGNDQLNQRVAFALSEIFVVSSTTDRAEFFPTYLNALSNNALGNFRTLMQDVTLSAGMGNYLNMLNNAKPTSGKIADENYARELMQLFTVGVNRMNMDGTLALDASGNPIANYTPAQVQALARAFTGWTYPAATNTPVTNWPAFPYFSGNMRPYQPQHDTESKSLLNGVTLPAGQSAEDDLNQALDALFQHPSLPPFICKQLIQHLVTSNPSPAYVSRIAQIFVNNGSGVRGDMRAVVRAILLDPEARAQDDPNTSQPDFGHLQEPILWITTTMRGLQPTKSVADASAYNWMEYYSQLMNQPLLTSPSVFNFFAPGSSLPGSSTLAGPEFGIENTSNINMRLQVADWMTSAQRTGNLSVDMSATGILGQQLQISPDQLLAYLNTLYMHGTMSSDMAATIKNAMSVAPNANLKIAVAIYLIITSPQFMICR